MHFVTSLSDILSLSYFYFVFVLCINFHPLWNQYTDSIVSPCICASLICQVWSVLHVVNVVIV